ncbi:MAG: Methyltransferase type 11 [Candidatus Woesebacteria bacterium GW2011_GWA1_39_11b]|nr:MAG: Methyltransferase type 11 [Candidatus Woesebacteria bacterium GW2011_GWA1_39_11b]KKS76866.1 MAG: hypothetical protein UV51_C0014G0007 [Candidatus Woesebacteria bacterium GW2011_GWC1_42_9]
MKDSYLSRLEDVYNQKSFQRKVNYIKYNFGPIIRNLKTRKDISVLEVGPGKGEFIKYLHTCRIKNIDVIDKDKNVMKSLQNNFNITNAFNSDNVASIKSKLRRYDLVILIQVLEHMSPKFYFSTIKTLFSRVKNNGYILIVVPNANNPLGLVERYGDLQHQMAFTEQSLKDLIRGAGIHNFDFDIKGYSIPPYDVVNMVRIILQKLLHLFLLTIMVINGGTYFKIMNPNIVLIIRKKA